MRDFRRYDVWHKSHRLAVEVYQATATFPKAEMYGLTNQMRRASVSIPSNIAEGCGRSSSAEFTRFLQIAMGSASELEYQLLLARDLGFLQDENHQALADAVIEIKRMLTGFMKKLKADG